MSAVATFDRAASARIGGRVARPAEGDDRADRGE